MRIVISEFMSLDGVVQAPGGRKEDTDGGFDHGGWSMPYFDPETMGAAIDEVRARKPCCSGGARGRRWRLRGLAVPATRSPIG